MPPGVDGTYEIGPTIQKEVEININIENLLLENDKASESIRLVKLPEYGFFFLAPQLISETTVEVIIHSATKRACTLGIRFSIALNSHTCPFPSYDTILRAEAGPTYQALEYRIYSNTRELR